MPDYSQAKIYCIKSSQTSEVYYGSTCSPLRQRFRDHKCHCKYTTSEQILQYEDAYIELVEEFPCNSRAELCIRERYYVENNPCVNKNIPGRSKEEYCETNKEMLIKYNREYMRQYREANNEKIKEYMRQYRANAKKQGGSLV